MTDRVKGLVVALAVDVRMYDAQQLMGAILLLKGVVDVKPATAETNDWFVRARLRRELLDKVRQLIDELVL